MSLNFFQLKLKRHRPMTHNSFGRNEETDNGMTVTTNDSAATKSQTSGTQRDSDRNSGDEARGARCCIVLCTEVGYKRLTDAYHLHLWQNESKENLDTSCHVYPIYCINDRPNAPTSIHPDYINPSPPAVPPPGKLMMNLSDILEFKELKPPDIMPQGNIGTPTKHFLELINACRLPPVIVKKLGLKFKKEAGKRIYSSVPFCYEQKTLEGQPSSHMMIGPAVTSQGGKIVRLSESILDSDPTPSTAQAQPSAPAEEVHSDGEAEEWDRCEAFVDDAANRERNKERLYEEKIELKWEKGGSGLVFYTDAQYWKKLEGDFDEQTTDDWDVDMSEYQESGAGDKDARDFIRMRAEDRLRGYTATLQEMSAFDKPLGSFEKHTKGVGRSVLEQQGWSEGKGVGKSETGRSNIIDTEGQHPRDKTGLGYHGERKTRFVSHRKRRADDDVIISTIYDDPSETDQPDSLLQRSNPHNIKHRTT